MKQPMLDAFICAKDEVMRKQLTVLSDINEIVETRANFECNSRMKGVCVNL